MSAQTETSSRRPRDTSLDRLRGVALLLMILGHSLVIVMATVDVQDWMLWTRRTITRFAMPIFMTVAGLLIARRGAPSMKRIPALVFSAIIFNVIASEIPELGFHPPNIILSFLMLLPLYPIFLRFPIECAAIGILQMWEWTIPWDVWMGYQPGEVLAFICLGVLLKSHPNSILLRGAKRLPRWLEFFGSRPLLWYNGHMTVLTCLGLFLLYR